MILIDNQCFPFNNLFKYSFNKTHIIIISCESYQKMKFRNRFVVAGSNGEINLSVPVQDGRNKKTVFKDVRICYDENWQINHWRTIVSCYNRSPFFEFYRDSLEPFFVNRRPFLFDYNLDILLWLQSVLHFKGKIEVVESLPPQFATEELEDVRNKCLPGSYQNEPSIYYPQVFEDRIGFKPNLSILDLLFNTGPDAGNILMKGNE